MWWRHSIIVSENQWRSGADDSWSSHYRLAAIPGRRCSQYCDRMRGMLGAWFHNLRVFDDGMGIHDGVTVFAGEHVHYIMLANDSVYSRHYKVGTLLISLCYVKSIWDRLYVTDDDYGWCHRWWLWLSGGNYTQSLKHDIAIDMIPCLPRFELSVSRSLPSYISSAQAIMMTYERLFYRPMLSYVKIWQVK
jgi:hypothetical protein